jgi:hypothetical protein
MENSHFKAVIFGAHLWLLELYFQRKPGRFAALYRGFVLFNLQAKSATTLGTA